ncbi:MAG: type 4a pilus biogenesis protein PilO [Chitinivibrionales bacterium]|nr:type 4a pilus biogenesis protein PilO [Chitinivibrionales bacterium]
MFAAFARYLRNEALFLLVAGAVVWGSAVLLREVGLPRLLHGRAMAASVAQYDSLLAGTGDYAALRSRLQATSDSLQQRYDAMTSGLGDAQDLSGLLEMLIAWAKAADIRFVRVQPQEQSEMGGYTTFPVLLEFASPYNALGRFVAGLESQPHVVRIERLAVNAKDPHEIEVKLLVTLFLRSLNKAAQ